MSTESDDLMDCIGRGTSSSVKPCWTPFMSRRYASPALSIPSLIFLFFSSYGDPRDLHSFPTRRSSDLGEVRFRDFDVVAEDGVESNFERADAGALALARFDFDQDRFRIAGDGAQFIELGVDAGLDQIGRAHV